MDIILYILATWRIASLLATEPGPWDVFEKLRGLVGTGNVVGKGLHCIWCNSLWIGAAWLALDLLMPRHAPYLAFSFALSTGAVVIDEVIGWPGQARPPS